MFVTKEADYAVRIIRELSRRGKENVQSICENELIPRAYAYKILKKLEKAGIVLAYRGVAGGYALAREPRLITLFDVITAVDGALLLSECLGHGTSCPMNGKGAKRCKVHGEFSRIQALILKHLKEKSLAEIFYD
jgi:Rrf2 family protein